MDALLAQSIADADATLAKVYLHENPPPPRYDAEMKTDQSDKQEGQQEIEAALAAKIKEAGVGF